MVDVHAPDACVESLRRLLVPGPDVDNLKHAQAQYFDLLSRSMDTPALALEHALQRIP